MGSSGFLSMLASLSSGTLCLSCYTCPQAAICSAALASGILKLDPQGKLSLPMWGVPAEPLILQVVSRRWARLGWCGQVQVVALECLPCIPAHMLSKALAGEELAKRIAQCLSNSSKEVRTAHTNTLPPLCPPCTAVSCDELYQLYCMPAHSLDKMLAGKNFSMCMLRGCSSPPQWLHHASLNMTRDCSPISCSSVVQSFR